MQKKTVIAMVIALLLIVGLIGCKKDNKPKEANNNNNETETINENNEENEKASEHSYDYVYPLTGEPANEDVDHRIVSVMINNHPAARPQSGLSQADLVFEILAEGVTTRFLAMFHSEIPDIVGPVRSAREYYFELARDYNSIYVYHGAAEFVNNMIINRGIENMNGAHYDNDGKLFKRESFRKAPHNSYFLMNNAYNVAKGKGYDITSSLEPFQFLKEDEQITSDGKATHAKIGYIGKQPDHTVEYTYDEQAEAYLRISDGVQVKELNGDTPILVNNVLILETYHEVFDSEGRRKIDLNSGGSAILLQKGMKQHVTWENRNGIIVPVKAGKVVGFVPGKTWINVVPSLDQSVEIIDE